MVNPGEYVINTATNIIFQLSEVEAKIINSGIANKAPSNIKSILCIDCKKRPATNNQNGTEEHFCVTCMSRKALGL